MTGFWWHSHKTHMQTLQISWFPFYIRYGSLNETQYPTDARQSFDKYTSCTHYKNTHVLYLWMDWWSFFLCAISEQPKWNYTIAHTKKHIVDITKHSIIMQRKKQKRQEEKRSILIYTYIETTLCCYRFSLSEWNKTETTKIETEKRKD